MRRGTYGWLGCGLVLGLMAGRAWCQELAPGQAGLHPILLKVFENVKSFTAEGEVQWTGAATNDAMKLSMQFSYRNGSMRAEVDMARIENAALTVEMMRTIQQIGMDRMVTIMGKETEPIYVLYPHLRSVVVTRSPDPPDRSRRKGGDRVRQVNLGQETVEGVVCEKSQFVQEREGRILYEATVWRDPSAKDAPKQIHIAQGGSAMRVVYRKIELKTPPKEWFEVPKGYAEYPTMEAVMKAALRKLLGESADPGREPELPTAPVRIPDPD